MASCTIPATNASVSGDALYGPRICWQAFIDWAWDVFDFDKGDWDQGFGYFSVCDNVRPLSRTLSGIYCLTYSSPDPLNESYSLNILQWGSRYARACIDELDARCGDGSEWAHTWWGWQDNKTELYLGFFYTASVSQRASVLLHEARHADGKGHDSGNNDSSWGYNGAWRWEVCWLSWFAAVGVNTSPPLQTQARQRGNNIINTRFVTHPGFNI